MSDKQKMHRIWVAQCDATQEIKRRHGVKAAFHYPVVEKLLNFANAASRHPEFARALPRFVSQVRRMFTPYEMRTHIARVDYEQCENDIDLTKDEAIAESLAAAAGRVRQFAVIKELLTAADLGTS